MSIFRRNDTGVDNQSRTGSSHLGQSTTIPLATLDCIQISHVASVAMKLLPKRSKHFGRLDAVCQSTGNRLITSAFPGHGSYGDSVANINDGDDLHQPFFE
jgi:hypothetical protein